MVPRHKELEEHKKKWWVSDNGECNVLRIMEKGFVCTQMPSTLQGLA